MKKIIGLLAVLLVSVFPCLMAQADSSYQWSVLNSNTFVIEGEEHEGLLYDYIVLPDQSARIIKCYDASYCQAVPESIDGHVVSEIGEYSYSGYDLTSLSLYIPDCVTTIQKNAFSNVFTKLELDISETHPTLRKENGMLICPAEKRIIRGGSAEELIIPEDIEAVDDHAFWGCTVQKVYIPSSVIEIGRNPFAFVCSDRDTYYRLQNVEISPNNTSLEILDGVLFSKDDHRVVWCFGTQFNDAADSSYVIPEGTEIIDDFAFQRWNAVRQIVIPASVTQIRVNPFMGRISLEGIHLDGNSRTLTLQNGMLISSADHRLVCASWLSDEIAIPEGVETIGDYAFGQLTPRIPCNVVLPDSVKVIGHNAFAYAETARIRIPAGVQRIGDYAFIACKGIRELPEFINLTIGKCAFKDCSEITTFVVRGETENAFSDYTNSEVNYLRGSTIGIGPEAFERCRHLETVIMAEGMKVIGAGAFFMCDSLCEVQLPESLLSIGENALFNGQRQEFVESLGRYGLKLFSTFHAVVPSGSYAERYCKENDIDFSIR